MQSTAKGGIFRSQSRRSVLKLKLYDVVQHFDFHAYFILACGSVYFPQSTSLPTSVTSSSLHSISIESQRWLHFNSRAGVCYQLGGLSWRHSFDNTSSKVYAEVTVRITPTINKQQCGCCQISRFTEIPAAQCQSVTYLVHWPIPTSINIQCFWDTPYIHSPLFLRS